MKPELFLWSRCACEALISKTDVYTTIKIYKFGKLTLQKFKYYYLRQMHKTKMYNTQKCDEFGRSELLRPHGL